LPIHHQTQEGAITPTRITKDDALNAILETNHNLSELAVGLGRLEERFQAMDDAHQERIQKQDDELKEKLDAIYEQMTAFRSHEATCPINQIVLQVDELRDYNTDYPSMVWLFRNRTKAMLAWTGFAISMLILTLAPWSDHRLLGALLKFIGVPGHIVEVIIDTDVVG
jgi:hypothetical protein